jgi:hypothetical protein
LSTEYLLDPWFIQLKPTDSTLQRFTRLNAWSRVRELSQKFGLSPVQFIDEAFLGTFQSDYQNYQRPDGNFIGAVIAKLVIQERHEGLAEICDIPCPELPINWRSALDHRGGDSSAPNWRRPFVVIPESRSEEWPEASEIRFKTSIDNKIRRRNLVQIEKYDQHDYCEPDLDPWRLCAVGAPAEEVTGAVRERHLSRRRLPRPVDLLPLRYSFDQIVQTLQQQIDWSCSQQGRAYYIPPEGWDPRNISQEGWRKGNAFPKGFARKKRGKRYYGPIDRENRIWLWDIQENHHWDVQLADGRHVNVSHEGKIL